MSHLDVNLEEQISAFPRGKNMIRECFVINHNLLSISQGSHRMQSRTSVVRSLIAATDLLRVSALGAQ